jgi:hypothetical protein
MSLKLSDLSVLAYANNFTLWHFKTEDASVETAGYFSNASDMMNVNDLIIANIDTDDTPVTTFYIVTDITGGDVTVTAYA